MNNYYLATFTPVSFHDETRKKPYVTIDQFVVLKILQFAVYASTSL